MAPPGKTGDRSHTTTVTVADTYTGYDPHSMMWMDYHLYLGQQAGAAPNI